MTDTPQQTQVAERPKPMPVHDDSEFAQLLDSDRFVQLMRVANAFAEAEFVPEAFQGKPANCFVALQMAVRLRVDPMLLMQNLYLVAKRPGMEAKLAIALINSRGPFTGPLQWKLEGEGVTRKCTCYATHRVTGERCESTITWKMAEAEGWTTKSGSKWKTIPDQMFQYRSASFLGRLYCPEVLLGLPMRDELEDIAPERQVTGERIQAADVITMPTARKAAADDSTGAKPATPETTLTKECAEQGAAAAETPAQQAQNDAQATPATADAGKDQPAGADAPAADLLGANVKADGSLKTKASPTQRKMIADMAARKGYSVAQLDEKIIARFAFGIDEMPAVMVNDVSVLVTNLPTLAPAKRA